MLDIRFLRNDPQQVAEALAIKGFHFDVDGFVALEEQRKALQQQTEDLQNERNTKSKSIGKAKAAGEDIAPLLADVGDLGARLDQSKAAFTDVQEALQNLLMSLPNMPHDSVPPGRDESDNKLLGTWGDPHAVVQEPLDHVDLAASGGLDFETAAKITGSRFVVMRGPMARLHRALTQFMLDLHTETHGYQEVYVPYIVNADKVYNFRGACFRIYLYFAYLYTSRPIPILGFENPLFIKTGLNIWWHGRGLERFLRDLNKRNFSIRADYIEIP